MIQLEGIHRSFARPDGSRLDVLCDVELEVERGDFVAVVGPSGSGKTTLMNLLGLLDRADEGTYRLAGTDVDTLSAGALARTRNRTLGFVFQQFHLLPRTTARENVELPLIYSDLDDPERRAFEALCRVGLEDRLDHDPSQLSGGQQQRVAIARALVTEPQVLLADEPTGNLDADSGDQVMQLLERLNQEGATIVLITHDPAVAARAGRVVSIDRGRVAETSALGRTA